MVINGNFESDQYTGTLTIGGKEYKVYLGRMEAQPVCEMVRSNGGKDISKKRC